MDIKTFKKTSNVTYVYVFGFVNNHSGCPYIGYIEVPYDYDTFCSFTEDQRKAVCQAIILKQSGHLVQGFRKCDPDEFFKAASPKGDQS
jgi:hypothetical protein